MTSDSSEGDPNESMESLSPRVRVVWLVLAILGALIVGFGGTWALSRFVLPVDSWVGPAAAVVLAVLGGLYMLLRYRIWRFEIQDDAVYLERGVVTRVDSVVPFVRIQNVDTQRGPIERLVGLSSVVVYTAGTRGADVTIPGLAPDHARMIREQLRDLAIESEHDDAV
ncbi:hypothetical protein C450_12415 [Halococcus salifodinae DSM 8989]|uniref:YdbS-like PH domain-containing protein n=2 Tax=Halococcaceae TaxID=1963270 RepID=M0N2B5_9EURY|nr:hypothetical protein C450_12415 [Halococcus salifodinae DSM 8989]